MKKTLTSLLLFLILFTVFLTSQNAFAKAYSKAFLSDYDAVWKGVLISLSKYPLDKNDQESGEIVTSVIKPGTAFKPYNANFATKEVYQLFIDVQKTTYKGRKVVRLKIEKKAFLKGDFMTQEKALTSDGIEENVILYRTAREIKIDKTVGKLFN